ncbi:hypothetical protein PMAYCL1PPCAC_13922, partial [Pristionchus mayeri]
LTDDIVANVVRGLTGKDQAADRDIKRRRSRKSFASTKCNESTKDSDREVGPSLKKRKSESVEGNKRRSSSTKGSSQSESVKRGQNNNQKNELECPECEFRSLTVGAWIMHLKLKHNTTPLLSKSGKKANLVSKKSDREMECPECEGATREM